MDKWDRILDESNVVSELKATRKYDAIRELCAVLENDNAIQDHERFLADVIRREQHSSTGIGKGVAVPHVHEDNVRRQILALGISRQGVDFQAVDGEPVHIVALFASPRKHQKQHMALLASLSRLLQQDEARQALIEADSAAAAIAVFDTWGS